MRIQVPNYRVLPKKDLPPQPTAAAHAAMPDSTEEAAYIRLRGQTQDEIETKIDYDLDSDDEQWLTKRKAKARKNPFKQLTPTLSHTLHAV